MPVYATPADVISRYDIRRLSQFLSDTGTPVCTKAQITGGTCAGVLATNQNLLNLITDASNKILMSCRVANRYLQSDLDAIYATRSYSMSNPALDRSPSLIRLCCDLTFGYVMQRRGLSVREISQLAPGFKDALQTLERLEMGLEVFDDAAPDGTDAPTAGVEVDVIASPGVLPPTNPALGCQTLWTQDVCRIFPGPNSGGGGGGF